MTSRIGPQQQQEPASLTADPAATHAQEASGLAQACRALWLTTLGLMTAHMQSQDKLERCFIARRIGSNLQTLAQQECFSRECRDRFARLGLHWHDLAEREQIASKDEAARGPAFWQGLWDSEESRC